MSGSLEAAISNLEQVLTPRFSLSKQKWQVNFSGHLHRLRRKSAQILNRDAISADEVMQRLHQIIEKDNTVPHGSADLAIDYMLNESSELSQGVNSWFAKWPEDNHTRTAATNPDGTIREQYMQYIHKGWRTDINLNTLYKLPRDFSVQAFGEYNTRSVTLLGSLGKKYYYSFSGKKEFKKAKMSVTVAAVNPFSAYIVQTELKERPSFRSVVDNRYYNRSFKITVGWEFGGGQKRRRERKKIENNDIKVQGKG